MKKYLSIAVGLILLPVMALAADVSLQGGSQISVGGYTLTTSGGFDSMVVSASSFTVTLSPGQTFTAASADRRKLTVDPTTYVQVTAACNSSEASISLKTTQDSGAATVTITPSTTNTCTTAGGGNPAAIGSSGGGGGGGSTVATVSTPAAVVTPAAPAVAQPSVVAQAVSPVFNKDLVKGARNDDVKNLQQLLATDKELYPEGIVSGLFGSLTEKAVRKFQLKYGVINKETDLGSGRLGPKTRAKIQEVFGGQSSLQPAQSTQSAEEAVMTSLQNQIKQLQDQINALLKKQ